MFSHGSVKKEGEEESWRGQRTSQKSFNPTRSHNSQHSLCQNTWSRDYYHHTTTDTNLNEMPYYAIYYEYSSDSEWYLFTVI